MATLDDELMLDAADDARAVAYIRTHLPQELQERFADEDLYYFLDVIVEYYAESGVLEQQPDADGYVDIDAEAIAAYVSEKARKEKAGTFAPEDLLHVVLAEMDYAESEAEG